MNREQKEVAVKDLVEKLAEGTTIYIADISGMNATQTSNLRRACFKANIKLSVVKNTLLKRAMDEVDKDFGELSTTVKGNTSLMFADTASAPAKLIKIFRKKTDIPLLKGAYIDEAIYIGDQELERLANIKNKEEVIGDIIAILQSPLKNVVLSLQSGKNKLAGIIKTLSDK